MYTILGLAGEVGEVANKMKKLWYRGDVTVEGQSEYPQPYLDMLNGIAHEMGDVLWYWLQLCTELNMNADKVAQLMFEKLAGRQERGTLKGSGDNR